MSRQLFIGRHMKTKVIEMLHHACGTWFVFTALVFVFVLSSTRPASAQTAPTWTENNAYQAYTAYSGTNYFYNGPNTFTWSNPTGNGNTYSIFVNKQGTTIWNTFWIEAEEIEVAEDAYYWAVKNGGNQQKYIDEVNDLCQGFIDKMKPTSNFNGNVPWNGGDPYNWHGSGYASDDYAPGPEGGDWFNDDLMWSAIAFARAYQITGKSGWLTAAEEQVDYVYAKAQAETNASGGGTGGTEVGLLQAFCNKNNGKDGDCSSNDTSWGPSLDAEVNFTFVIAADLLANNTSGATKTTYLNERDAVYKWAMDNLYSTTSTHANNCTASAGVTCAEIYDSNRTASFSGGSFNGENGYWSGKATSAISTWDFSMNYGTAIQAATREGDFTSAQNIANYLMYGLSNPNHGYATTYSYNGNTYKVLPNYGTEGSNYDGSNGIALRGVGFGLSRSALNNATLLWAQANLQAAWNQKNSDNVIWNDWTDSTGSTSDPLLTPPPYVYDSWDCSDAVVGLLDITSPQ